MEPVYVDVHIHTSENPDCLNQDYDIDTLLKQVRVQAQKQHALISLTDHNTINKKAYLDAMSKCESDIHLLLGVELHIHYVIDTEAYHCHIFFKDKISEQKIDDINIILDRLYKKKTVTKTDKSLPIPIKNAASFRLWRFPVWFQNMIRPA